MEPGSDIDGGGGAEVVTEFGNGVAVVDRGGTGVDGVVVVVVEPGNVTVAVEPTVDVGCSVSAVRTGVAEPVDGGSGVVVVTGVVTEFGKRTEGDNTEDSSAFCSKSNESSVSAPTSSRRPAEIGRTPASQI